MREGHRDWSGRRTGGQMSQRDIDTLGPGDKFKQSPRGMLDAVKGGYQPFNLPQRSIALEKIKHDDWTSLEEDPKTWNQIGLIRTAGVLQEPCVRHLGHGTYEIIWGEHQLAAARLDGWEKMVCKVLQCDKEEGLMWRLAHASTAGTKREKRQAQVSLLRLRLSKIKPGKGSQTIRKGIRQMFADMMQLPYSTVLTLDKEYRAEAERRRRKRRMIERGVVEDHGCGHYMDAAWLRSVNATAKELSELSRKAKMAIPRVVQYAGDLYHGAEVAEITGTLRTLERHCNAAQPRYICPFCKGLSKLRPSCARCRTRGFLTSRETSDIPSALWDPDRPRVMVNGEMLPIQEYQDADPTDIRTRGIPKWLRPASVDEALAEDDTPDPDDVQTACAPPGDEGGDEGGAPW